MANFSVPYLSRLEGGGFQPGQTVVLKGVQTGNVFSVLFLTGSAPETADAPLSVVVNQKEKHMYLNDRTNGKYGKEIKQKDPFKEGEPFDLRIRCHDNKFEIFTNLKHLADFEYRQPLNTINHLFVDGNIDISDVNWGGKYYPVPYQAGVEGGFTNGKKLFVSAFPEKKCENFTIQLLTANQNSYSFRFVADFKKKEIRCNANATATGEWGFEEKDAKFPFHTDQAFDILIDNEPTGYQVYVNNAHCCAFSHKSGEAVKGLKIEGDIILTGVHVK